MQHQMRPRMRTGWLMIWLCAAAPAASALTLNESSLTRIPWQQQCGSQYVKATGPFLTTESDVNVYFLASGVQITDSLHSEWIQPNGNVIVHGAWNSVSGDRCYYDGINIDGFTPGRTPGVWQARVMLNGSELFSYSFRIVQLDGNTLRATAALTGTTVLAAGEGGTILRTTNGGLTWQALNSGTANDLEGIAFGDASTGTAVGSGGTILRTVNGGATWSAQLAGTLVDLRGVALSGANTGLAVGEGGAILRTTDGGANWSPLFSGASDDLWGVCFADARTAIAVGDNGRILRSADGGVTWVSQASATNSSLFAISCADANRATAVGDAGTILHTEDGGVSWQAQSAGTLSDLWGVSFSDAKTGTVVGETNTILRTIDGGATWSSQTPAAPNWLYAVSFASGNAGTAVGFGGAIRQTSDGGLTWRAPTASAPLPAGRYRSLNVLATAVNGNLTAQVFTINYTDGTSSTFRQNISDWLTPQKFPGETVAATMPYRNRQDANKDTRTTYAYSYVFPLDETKTVSSVVRPASRTVALLALTLTPASGPPVPVDLSRLFNVVAMTTDGLGITGDLDGNSIAYSMNQLQASPAVSGTPFRLGPADAPNAVLGNWLTLASSGASGPAVPVDITKGTFSKIRQTILLNRQNHTATLLKDGRVLIVGGFSQSADQPPLDRLGPPADTAYFFNPATGALTTAGVANVARAGHTATLLADGRVLIAGGQGLDSTEIYDPATGKFTLSARMQTARFFHAAILLANGRVLIAGGMTGQGDFTGSGYVPAASSEIFNPVVGAFQPAGNMSETRSSFTLTALANGSVLAVGGASADLFDPATGNFRRALQLGTPRTLHATVRLADDRILVAGGDDGKNPLRQAELIAADGSATTPVANMVDARDSFQATLLNGGLVLLTGTGPPGAASAANAEIYDPKAGSFRRIPQMSYGRTGHTATKIADGRVVLAGGNGADGVLEYFTPAGP